MSISNLSSNGRGPSLPVRVPAKRPSHLQKNAEDSLSSSSTVIAEDMSYGHSPTSTLQSVFHSAPYLKSDESMSLYKDVDVSLNKVTSSQEHRLENWRNAFAISKQLAFEDSEDLHRNSIAKVISHIGHLQESPSELELRGVFRAALFKSKSGTSRSTDKQIEESVSDEINRISNESSKLLYIHSMIRIVSQASLQQQFGLMSVLLGALKDIGAPHGVSATHADGLQIRTHEPIFRTLRHSAGAISDAILLLGYDINTFSTAMKREELLAEQHRYPKRNIVSAQVMYSTHIV